MRPDTLERRLAAMRAEFDRAFAAPPVPAALAGLAVVQVAAAGERYALPVADLQAVVRAGRVLPLPGARAGLLGLAGIRGRLVPVLGLGELAGRTGERNVAWIAVCQGPEPLGLGFSELLGLGSIQAAEQGERPPAEVGRHIRSVVHVAGGRWLLVDIPAVVTATIGG